jgi:predicted metal-dependent phosphoesterase TrpH
MSTFKIDLHLHTCASKDSALRPAEMIETAKRRGLNRICITDHNTLEGALAARKIDPDFVIVGEEIVTSNGGELLAFFVQEWVPPYLSPQETLERLAAQGAVISVSHPFDRYRHPWPEKTLVTLAAHLDAIEGFNARAVYAEDNHRAAAFAAAHHLPLTAGSDAHTALEVGAAYLEMPAFATAAEFRAGLSAATVRGRLTPIWIHLFSTINKLRTLLKLKPRIE